MDLRVISRLLYQIKIINQEVNTLFEKETGFSLTRYEMLMFLKEKGTCSQNQIQAELKIDSAAITRHLKILEQKGYVIRQRNAENNREVFVQLSEQAIQDLAACGKAHEQGKSSLSLSLSDEEAEQLSELLNKLYLKR
ncbi:MarR family winged helix-turn-helix transcriptional regulator [Trichococcus pasteurii]|uniref:Helix turn helix arsenical resistance operon repressor n=1 Tax=Trichococcus pasteurii TaxID=43064 RepID=A0A1W1IEI0_9LACT|nr:MarR family transcriptional regulator [Trichococcus pasteurii]SFE12614.1 DNA-binding transcriptional regulator, MarR family [Trichococcus pasteurii]SLM51418.1 helix turn helix arsenical resistance operon repressor [Trichococcus pasteurii]SSB92299.1 helix turn helix arsenical resistance operon repressor [Trichococcus pasteurii]